MHIDNINYQYPKSDFQLSLQDIDLSAPIVALLGANGCGKSTLMKLISGQIAASGKNTSHIDTGNKRIIVHDAFSYLNDFMTVQDHLKFFACLHKRSLYEYDTVVNDCNLTSILFQRIDSISAGQAARMRIASSLLAMPDIMLLDEPTTGCDISTVNFFVGIIKMLVDRNVQCVLVTHQLYEISSLKPTVLGLHDGKLLGLLEWQNEWNTADGLQTLMQNIVNGRSIVPVKKISPNLHAVRRVTHV